MSSVTAGNVDLGSRESRLRQRSHVIKFSSWPEP